MNILCVIYTKHYEISIHIWMNNSKYTAAIWWLLSVRLKCPSVNRDVELRKLVYRIILIYGING